jgi:uncharacterized Ntn-hydrolase superfamily protein
MTYSIVARDAETGDLAVAVQSKFPCVGVGVPMARAGVGAVSCSAFSNLPYRDEALRMLGSGSNAREAVARLAIAEQEHQLHQLGVVDAEGISANHTGHSCFAWAGGRTAPDVAVQGNILAGPQVVDALYETFETRAHPFPELLVSALREADAAGGDRRGRQSAVLIVVRERGGWGGGSDQRINLRVDDSSDPVAELERLLAMWRLHFDRPRESDLVPIDEQLAADLRHRLTSAGFVGGIPSPLFAPMWPEETREAELAAVGDPRPLSAGWDDGWQAALTDWMRVENLEERAAADGWIDPLVLTYLRDHPGTRQSP